MAGCVVMHMCGAIEGKTGRPALAVGHRHSTGLLQWFSIVIIILKY